MGDCCNAKILSCISAWIQIVASAFLVLCLIVAGGDAISEELRRRMGSTETFTIVLVLTSALLLVNIVFLVILLLGLQHDRITLVKIYLYPNIVVMILSACAIFINFLMGFVNKQPTGLVFAHFFDNAFRFGLNVLLLSPICVHFKNMSKPPHEPIQYGFLVTQVDK